MYKLSRNFLFCLPAIIIVLLPSCSSERGKPSFDYLRTQLTTDLFRELKEGNTETVLNNAERLRNLGVDREAITLMATMAETRLFFRHLNNLMTEGKIETAQELLQKKNVPYLGRQQYNVFENTLENLQAMQDYLDAKPYDSGLKGYKKLMSLADAAPLLRHSEFFSKWFERETENLLFRRKREILTTIWKHIREKGSPESDAIVRLDIEPLLEQLCEDLKNPTFKKLRNILKNSNAEDLNQVLRKHDQQETGRSLEILASWYWPRLNKATKDTLSRYLKNTVPVSDAGIRLKCLLAAGQHSIEDGIKNFRIYVKSQRTPDEELLHAVLPVFVLPWRQLRAAPWLQAYPSFCDILDQTTQLRLNIQKGDN